MYFKKRDEIEPLGSMELPDPSGQRIYDAPDPRDHTVWGDRVVTGEEGSIADYHSVEDHAIMHQGLQQTIAAVKAETGDRKRKDAGKVRGWHLLPRRPMELVAELYAIGAAKYAPRGWEHGMEWSRVLDPAFRHLFKYMSGERYDKVDGQHHLASVVWACLALMEYEHTHPELDDIHDPDHNPLEPLREA